MTRTPHFFAIDGNVVKVVSQHHVITVCFNSGELIEQFAGQIDTLCHCVILPFFVRSICTLRSVALDRGRVSSGWRSTL